MWLDWAVIEGRRESWGCRRRGPSGTTLDDASWMRQHLGEATRWARTSKAGVCGWATRWTGWQWQRCGGPG